MNLYGASSRNKLFPLQRPLVSVILTTYNSAKFVVETLESARAQTYRHIELIVSDDCSNDNTVEICRNWIALHKDRFVRTAIITVPVNTGVSANCNRCIKASGAAWIKLIAGDDILLPNCIEDNMQFVVNNPQAAVVFSQVLLYIDEFVPEKLVTVLPDSYPMNLMRATFSAEDQYKLLLLSDRITYTPSSFFNKQTLLAVGGFDEANKLVEDYPMWLKLTKAGNKLHFFKKATVGYRKHDAASNNMSDSGLFKPLFLKLSPFFKKDVYPFLPWDIAGSKRFTVTVARFFQLAGLNKNTSLNRALYKMATVFFNPFHYVIFCKRKLMKQGQKNVFYVDIQ